MVTDDALPAGTLPITGAVVPVPVRVRRNWTREDQENADEMGTRVPETLYRYVKLRYRSVEHSPLLREYVAATVKGSTLHFSNYTDMNDPFEGSFSVSVDADAETKVAYWTEAGREHGKTPAEIEATVRGMLNATSDRAFEKVVQDNFSTQGLCCFTGNHDDVLAWSYYAGGHGGLCLRFRMKTLFQTLGQSPGMLLEVQYKEHHPHEQFYQSGMFNMLRAALCTKAKMWEHEGEWRIVLEGPGDVAFPPHALDGIVMGCRITPDDEEFVRSLVAGRKPPIELLRAVKKEREYALQIVTA